MAGFLKFNRNAAYCALRSAKKDHRLVAIDPRRR
jgi:hypothetical protein